MPQSDTGNWIVPFQGRNKSAVYNQNFLWQFDNVYVMDNHRAAYWCWLRHCDTRNPFNLIHIDRHTDTLGSQLDIWLEVMPDVASISIEEYLSFEHNDVAHHVRYPLFRWDNYLSIFLARHSEQLRHFFFATHGEGDKPNVSPTQELTTWHLPGEIRYLREHDSAPWICNVDLDYFFYSEDQDVKGRFMSDTYIDSLFSTIDALRRSEVISVVTICLSPECSGGWDSAEQLAARTCDILQVPFSLPSPDLG